MRWFIILLLHSVTFVWMINLSRGDLGCPNNDPCIFFTDGQSIKGVDAKDQNGKVSPTKYTVLSSSPGGYAMDIDMNTKTLFWSEQSPSWKIRSMDLKTGTIKDVISTDIGEVEGISVDPIQKNIYWTDFTRETIEVATYDGRNRKTLFDKDSKDSLDERVMHNPKAIAVHPTKGYMYWVDFSYLWLWGFFYVPYQEITRSTLAGTELNRLRYFVSSKNHKYYPMSLTLDLTEDRLYFYDSVNGNLKSMDLDGRSVVTHHSATHAPLPSEMTKLGDTVYWTDRKSYSIERLKIMQGDKWRRMSSFGRLSDNMLRGITSYNMTNKTETTMCSMNNGNCSHLCLLTPTKRVCACPNGVKLLANSSTNCSNVTSIVTPPTPPVVQVRLRDGRTANEGRVEVQYVGIWGTICDDNFDMTEADVVCKMLNYSRALAVNYTVPSGTGQILLDKLKCRGDEKSISYCNHLGWGTHDCTHIEDVGVVCDNGTRENQIKHYNNASDLKVRLIKGQHPWEGLVQVYTNRTWGTICDTKWTLKDADVICKMKNYKGAWDAQGNAYFGMGTGRIWTSNVQCHGNETSIGQCASAGWGKPVCTHADDVSVTCIKPDDDSKEIRLRGGHGPSEGFIEIKRSGAYGWFCDTTWTKASANVACRELGYPLGAVKTLSSFIHSQFGSSLYLGMNCTGSENKLEDCSPIVGSSSSCNPAGVICKTGTNKLQDIPSFVLAADRKRGILYQLLLNDSNNLHSSASIVIDKLESPNHMAFDPTTRHLYVTSGRIISKVDLFTGKMSKVITAVGNIHDIRVDHVCKKLYWVMYYNDAIMVSNLDGTQPIQVVAAEYIRGLTLDIKNGVMYYFADYTSSIYVANMDGSDKKKLIELTFFAQPYSLIIDEPNKFLYWVDDYDNQIRYLNLSAVGSGYSALKSIHVHKPYELDILRNYLYWTDNAVDSTGGLYRLHLSGDKRHHTELVLSDLLEPNGIAVLDDNYLPENTTCTNCQCQICLRIPSGHRCNCSTIQVLNETTNQCYTPDFFVFTEYYDEAAIMIPEDEKLRHKSHTISLEQSYIPDAVECDPVDSNIFYGDLSRDHISRTPYNGSFEEIIVKNISYPKGLAIDHVGRNLYYTDSRNYSIYVSKLDGSNVKTLLYTNPEAPAAITVDSETGYMYWGSLKRLLGKNYVGIHRATMSGTSMTTLAQWSVPYRYGPSQMTIDKKTNRLYWVGWHDSFIEYINIDNSASSAFVNRISGYGNYLYMPNGIAVLNNKIYWTDEYDGKLYQGNDAGSFPRSLVSGKYGIGALKYCRGKPAPKSDHPCANRSTCSHLCLVTPNGHFCECPDKLLSGSQCERTTPPPTTAPPPTTTAPPTTTTAPPTTTTAPPTTTTAPPTTTTAPPTTTTAPPTTTTAPPTTTTAPLTTTTAPPITTFAPPTTTTAPPTTTTAPPPTTKPRPPPVVFPGSCEPNPCLNGGVCEVRPGEQNYMCICPQYYVPAESCEIYVGQGVVDVSLGGNIPESDIWMVLDAMGEAFEQGEQPQRRKRRATVTQTNVTVYNTSAPDYSTPTQTKLEVAAVALTAQGKPDPNSVVPADSLEKKVETSKAKIVKVLQTKFNKKTTVLAVKASPKSDKATRGKSTGTKGASSGTIAAVVVVLLILIVISAALIYYFRFRKHFTKHRFTNEESSSKEMGTFSNPGFGVDPPVFDSPMQGDAMGMSPTSGEYQPSGDIRTVDNPLYAVGDSQGISFTEKPTKMTTPQNVYAVPGGENVYEQPGVKQPGYETLDFKRQGLEHVGSEKPKYEELFPEKPASVNASDKQSAEYKTFPSDEVRYKKPRQENPYDLPDDGFPDNQYDNPAEVRPGNLEKWENFEDGPDNDQGEAGAGGTLKLHDDEIDTDTSA